ncbi:MAG: hypothetical protein GC204_21020 [Chloroflexi bacterium]|nr:hypothetical protein [Chloroflexota bacterium]
MNETVEGRLRRFLLLLTITVFLATLVELILEEHTKETLQFIPFFLCALGLIAVTAALLRPQRKTLLVLRVSMIIVALGGVVGVATHLLNNYEFEQEIRPTAALADLIVATLKGANPLLAPGVLIFGALIALLATYGHPALAKTEAAPLLEEIRA